jgi:hypothetical protein
LLHIGPGIADGTVWNLKNRVVDERTGVVVSRVRIVVLDVRNARENIFCCKDKIDSFPT